MARRRRVAPPDVREELLRIGELMLGHMDAVGAADARVQRRYVEDLRAGRPVVIAHGYQLDLGPDSGGPWLLERDGTVTALVDTEITG